MTETTFMTPRSLERLSALGEQRVCGLARGLGAGDASLRLWLFHYARWCLLLESFDVAPDGSDPREVASGLFNVRPLGRAIFAAALRSLLRAGAVRVRRVRGRRRVFALGGQPWVAALHVSWAHLDEHALSPQP